MIHIALFRITILNFILALAFLLMLVLPALAQSAPGVDIIPAEKAVEKGYTVSDTPTHPELRLTPDKSELIKLEGKAGSIIIGNPNHINILADSSTQLIIVPRAPGASYFTVLDEKGEMLMQRHVIVASPKNQYMRVRRNCAAGTGACATNSVYYCPDMCHEIMLDETATDAPAPPEMDEEDANVSVGSALPVDETDSAPADSNRTPTPAETDQGTEE